MSSWKPSTETMYHFKSITEINTLQCFHENQVQNIVSDENIKEINTLQCLHEIQVQNIVTWKA